ncbi:hypothetical protein [Winogradskya consettensis]|nr:hypothetical protein [Actinoplanes consettensis]
MERGPLALFGALVAVGLGPAMWLGAQFGESTLTPQRPPAVTRVQQNEIVPPGQGGEGAGITPSDPAEIIHTDPAADPAPQKHKPRVTIPSTEDNNDEYTGAGGGDDPTTTPATPSSSPSADPEPSETSDDPDTPPTDEPTDPETDPTDETSDPPSGPEVPTTNVTTQSVVND